MTAIDTHGTSPLPGLRRGEIAGQRWADIDLEQRTLRIGATRVDVGGRALDQEPKTANAGRVLPIPDALLTELTAAKNRQAAEKLALGEAYTDQGFVVCNEAGEPYHPSTLSTLWQTAIRNLDVPQIRLHDARHTCATLMHLQGVPIALVAAWLRHADVSFTMRTYVHAELRRWNSRRAALLDQRPTPGVEQLAHACGDIHQAIVTNCDNFDLIEHWCDQREMHTPRSKTYSWSG